MRAFSLGEIEKITGGKLIGASNDTEVTNITIDSRLAKEGTGFAALKGERVDGHDYVQKALKQNAPFCLVERELAVNGAIIVVENVGEAMKKIALANRLRYDIPLIGVTGSVGKTTTKEMLSAVLSERYKTHKTQGNFNNELGVPLTLYNLEPEHEVSIVEMGISDFGEMSRLTQIARPNIAVFANIGNAHLEFLGDRQGVLKAKTEMLENMTADDLVILNGDDDVLAKFSCDMKLLRYGLSDICDVRAENIKKLADGGTKFDVVYEKRKFTVEVEAFGEHMVYAVLVAATVAMSLGLSDEEIINGVKNYKPVGSRASVLIADGFKIIDDCYNANPDSVLSSLKSASSLDGRLVCVLGDMNELGENKIAMHEYVGEEVRALADLLITTGDLAKSMGGVHFETKEMLMENIASYIKKGDIVLVKASNSKKFGDIVEVLKNLKQ